MVLGLCVHVGAWIAICTGTSHDPALADLPLQQPQLLPVSHCSFHEAFTTHGVLLQLYIVKHCFKKYKPKTHRTRYEALL